jgi:hypothetical protein
MSDFDWINEINIYKEKETQPPRVVRALFYGDMGTGKTRCACTFPNPFIIDTDKGLVTIPPEDRPPNILIPYGRRGGIEEVRDIIINFRDRTGVFGDYLGDRETLVLDGISSYADIILYEDPKKTKPDWDDWSSLLNICVEITQICKDITDRNVVFTASSQLDQDRATGAFVGLPEIQGSFRNKIGKQFDEVYYFAKDGQGENVEFNCYTQKYKWFDCKSRLGLPPVVQNPTYETLYGDIL